MSTTRPRGVASMASSATPSRRRVVTLTASVASTPSPRWRRWRRGSTNAQSRRGDGVEAQKHRERPRRWRIEHTHDYTSQKQHRKKTQVGGLPLERFFHNRFRQRLPRATPAEGPPLSVVIRLRPQPGPPRGVGRYCIWRQRRVEVRGRPGLPLVRWRFEQGLRWRRGPLRRRCCV